jgi:membrane protease YdiL (CAAX protease family)
MPPSAPLPGKSSREDPPWGLKDVLALPVLTLLAMLLLGSFLSLLIHHYRSPKTPILDILTWPEVGLVSEVLVYLAILGVMYWLASSAGTGALETLRWNWPDQWPNHWAVFLLSGAILSIAFDLLGRHLPMPNKVPMDEFFRTPRLVWLVSIFGITLAPLMEELFFRGFLYPALARRLGVAGSIVLTGLAFGALHAVQLGFHWAPLLILALVGTVLTAVRAVTKSVASTFLMHVGYNFALMALVFAVTDGFRHLDRMRP